MVAFDEKFVSSPLGNLPLSGLPSVLFASALQGLKRLGLNYIAIPAYSLKYLSNPASLAGLYLGTKESAEVRFRGGRSFVLKRQGFKSDLWILVKIARGGVPLFPSRDLGRVSLAYRGRKATVEGPGALGLSFQLFFNNEYGPLDPKGAEAVDVGANIGDTAVFLALSGAARVLAYEPYRFSYEFAKRNVEQNGLSGIVELHRAAVGAASGHIVVESAEGTTISKQATMAGQGEKIPVVGLSGIAGRLRGKNALLKLDCEGAEYAILLGAPDSALGKFGKIVMEYHYGYVNIKKRLEAAGFKVTLFGTPRYYYDPAWKNPHVRIGMLMAERKG